MPATAPAPALAAVFAGLTIAAVPAEPVVVVDATMVTVAHGGRLEEGALFAWSRRLDCEARVHTAVKRAPQALSIVLRGVADGVAAHTLLASDPAAGNPGASISTIRAGSTTPHDCIR